MASFTAMVACGLSAAWCQTKSGCPSLRPSALCSSRQSAKPDLCNGHTARTRLAPGPARALVKLSLSADEVEAYEAKLRVEYRDGDMLEKLGERSIVLRRRGG